MGILERVSREFPHIEGVLAVNPASSLYLCKWGQKTAPKKPSHSMCRKFPRQIFPELKSTGAEKSRRRKFPALKSLSAEKYRCRKVPVPKKSSAEKSPCRKVHVSKRAHVGMSRDIPDAEIALCQNVPVPKIPCAENSPCRKGPMPKRSRVEMSICQNVCSAERCTCRNVPVMKYLRRNDYCRNVLCRKSLQAAVDTLRA